MEAIETPQPIQPVETKSTDWTKIILAAVVGFGFLASSTYAGYWYGTQTPVVLQTTPTSTPEPTTPPITDPTAGWKTYTDTRYDYSAKYPQDWVKLEEGSNYVRFFKGPYEEGMPMTETYISISVEDNPDELSLKEWLEKTSPPYDKIGETKIDGQVAVKYAVTPIGNEYVGKGSTMVFTEKNRVIYHLSLVLMGGNREEAIDVFDQILSTFKFLD